MLKYLNEIHCSFLITHTHHEKFFKEFHSHIVAFSRTGFINGSLKWMKGKVSERKLSENFPWDIYTSVNHLILNIMR